MIADRAGVGKGTVYRYFRSKEDLFWATTLDVLERLDRRVFAAMEGVEGACDKLRAAAIAHAAFFQANPQYLNLIIQERAEFCGSVPESHRAHHEKMLQRMSAILGQGIESGELRPLDTRQTTLAIGCLLFGTALLSGHVESVNLMKMTGYAIDIFLRAMRNDASDEDGTLLFDGKPTIMNAALAERSKMTSDSATPDATAATRRPTLSPCPAARPAARHGRWWLDRLGGRCGRRRRRLALVS